MFDHIATFVTKYCTVYFVVLFSFGLRIFNKKHSNGALLYLLGFMMIINTILKELFAMPGPFSKGPTDYAFPSGHMTFDSVFFIILMLLTKNNLLRGVYALMLSFFGFCMVYKGYHYPLDVILAPLFAISVVVLYKFFIDDLSGNRKYLTLLLTNISLLFAVVFLRDKFESHIIMAFSFCFGLLLSEIISQKPEISKSVLSLVLFSVFIPSFLILLFNMKILSSALLFGKFFGTGFIVGCLGNFFNKRKLKKAIK